MPAWDNRGRAGVILMIVGALSLLLNLDLLPFDGGLIVGLLFLVGGAAVFASGRKSCSALKFYGGIVAMLIGFSIVAGETDLVPGEVIGTAYLWTAGSLFLRVHLNRRDCYWPIIPAGILFAVGLAIALLGFRLIHDETVGAMICLGIAGTFAYLYSVRNEHNKLEWTKYPAAAMLTVAVIVYLSGRRFGLDPLVFGVTLILAGIGLVVNALRSGRGVVANDLAP